MAVFSVPIEVTGKARKAQGTFVLFEDVEIPYTLIEGAEAGPTVLIIAGVHGAENCGIKVADNIAANTRPENLKKGLLLVISPLNQDGHERQLAAVMPQDGKNLNREFPGSENGTYTQRFAHALVTKVFPRVDYLIDLHSGDLNEHLTPFVAYTEGDEASRALTISTAWHLIVQIPNGHYSISGALFVGVPGIIMEFGFDGTYTEELLYGMTRCISNVVGSLDMLRRSNEDAMDMTYEEEHASTTRGRLVQSFKESGKEVILVKPHGYEAPAGGIWTPNTKPSDQVKVADLLGNIVTDDRKTMPINSEVEGHILYHTKAGIPVKKGEQIVCVGVPVE